MAAKIETMENDKKQYIVITFGNVFTNTSRIIILKIEQKGVLGIIVDEVKEVVTLGSEEIDKVAHNPKDVKSTFINGIGKNGDDLISLFDISSVVDEKENS